MKVLKIILAAFSVAVIVGMDKIKDVRESDLVDALVRTIDTLGQDIEADRSGSDARIGVTIPLDDMILDIIDGSTTFAEKVMR